MVTVAKPMGREMRDASQHSWQALRRKSAGLVNRGLQVRILSVTPQTTLSEEEK